ncbi:type IX secretion system outer membrane channel protein PorV [Runella sp.]|uniref:type IX secretion system outer membrane channel protein PorV n=1 Tax=Runella sp. TaxID=1960881 RepID=UPI003D1285F2
MIRKISPIFTLLGFCGSLNSLAQITSGGQDSTGGRPVVASVPFAAFTPDARSAAMGDAGAALSPDANSVYWGAAKLVHAKKEYGVALSYTPWLRNITEDMSFAYLSGFKKIGKNQAVGISLMYFDHGKFEARNNFGTSLGDYYSNEFYGSIAYSRKLTDHFSMGLNVKYLVSNLGNGVQLLGGSALKAGQTAAGDISAFYQNENIDEGTGKGWHYSGALMIQNIGGKVNYGGTTSGFIPTTLKLGGTATRHIDPLNKITFALDLNKLMIPTPGGTASGQDVGTISAMFKSFGDAPGGFSEELREFMIATGVEYWYNDAFAVRFGYFNESKTKGNRKYFTVGFGARIQQRYGIDFAYLMPQTQGSPLANTFRVSLVIDMFKKAADVAEDIE